MATTFLTPNNNAESTLDGAITNIQTYLDVASDDSFPASYPFRITVDNEIMTVTASPQANRFTVTRGAESTSGVSHNNGTPVYMNPTAGAISEIHTAINALENATYVDTSGTPVDNDFAKFTDANTIEGRSYSEVRSDLNIEDGADVTDPSNVNAAGAVMESDFNATTFLYATSDDTPQPKTPANVMGILSGQAGADFSMNTHKITGVVDPTSNQDAATKKYVDDNAGGTGLLGVHNFFIKKFDASDWTIVESGASADVSMEFGLACLTAGHAGDERASAGLKVYRYGAYGHTSKYDADYSLNSELEWIIAQESNSSYNQCWLVHSKYDGSFAIDGRPTTKSYGFKLDGLNIITWTHDGTDYDETDTFEDLTRGQVHALRCKFYPGSKMEAYLDGSLIATITDNIPSTTMDYGSGIVMSVAANASASLNNVLNVFRVYYSCEY